MLFIYHALSLGGIETFYVRMAKARHQMGKKTKILLTDREEASDPYLLREMRKYCEVYFLNDFLKYRIYGKIIVQFLLLFPINTRKISIIFQGVQQVHVSSSIYGLFYLNIIKYLKIQIPLTIGVYHSKEFIWKSPSNLPFYELINRQLFSDLLRLKSVYFFNDKLPDIYTEYFDFEIDEKNVFPLGVIDSKKIEIKKSCIKDVLRIVSVGRLVNFKTYNLWMIDVIKSLENKINVEFYIYGSGPLEQEMIEKIERNNLKNKIFLKGSLPYSELKNTISKYDIFIGSGTVIVEASSLGIPSIVGIESEVKPVSYGFVSNISGYSYNEDNLYEKYDVEKIILDYLYLDSEKKYDVKNKHVEWAQKFSMENCVSNFEGANFKFNNSISLKYTGIIFKLKYTFSFIVFSLIYKLRRKKLSDSVYG